MSHPIAKVEASAPRRLFALCILFGLAGLLLYLAITTPGMQMWGRVIAASFGMLALVLGEKLRRASFGWLELTEDGLYDHTGRLLVAMDEVVGVDRGHLANKPSNGFVIRTKTKAARAWSPGMWWRAGRRIGVGGVTSASQSKSMADLLLTIVSNNK